MAERIDPPASPAPKGTEALEQDVRELAILDSKPQTFTLSGKSYTVGKLKVRQLGPFMDSVKEAVPLILQSIAQTGEIALSALIERGFTEALARAMSIVTGHPADDILDMDAEDFMVLAGKILTVNMDFFFHRLPEVSGIVGGAVLKAALAMGKKPTVGEESSSDSSPTGTDSPK